MRFLVVDPDVAFATLLTEELVRQGHEAVACVSGYEACQVVRARWVDMALLDMALKNPDALDVGRQLRALQPGIRLMLIPLLGDELALDDGEPAIQGVLPKPFFLPELPERIEAALTSPVPDGGREPGPTTDVTGLPPASGGPPDAAEVGDVLDRKDALHRGDAPDKGDAPDYGEVPYGRDARLQGLVTYKVSTAGEARLSELELARHAPRIEALLAELAVDIGAASVLLTSQQGVLAAAGSLAEREISSISAAVLTSWATSAEVARILGREQLRFEQSLTGGSYMLYALSVGDAILAVTVNGSTPLGLLRHQARSVGDRIAELCGGG